MRVLRVIDKKTNLFLRDDFSFDEDLDFGLITEPAQGLYKPKWSGEIIEDEEGNIIVGEGEWIEGATQEEINELTKTQPQEPSIEEQLALTEELLQSVTMAFNNILQAIEKGDLIDE